MQSSPTVQPAGASEHSRSRRLGSCSAGLEWRRPWCSCSCIAWLGYVPIHRYKGQRSHGVLHGSATTAAATHGPRRRDVARDRRVGAAAVQPAARSTPCPSRRRRCPTGDHLDHCLVERLTLQRLDRMAPQLGDVHCVPLRGDPRAPGQPPRWQAIVHQVVPDRRGEARTIGRADANGLRIIQGMTAG